MLVYVYLRLNIKKITYAYQFQPANVERGVSWIILKSNSPVGYLLQWNFVNKYCSVMGGRFSKMYANDYRFTKINWQF